MKFRYYKDVARKMISKALTENVIDREIIFLLDIINSAPDYYTTSSCYGRIVVAESTPDNKKKAYRFLGKWHRTVTMEDVEAAVGRYCKDILLFRLDPLILHVGCKDMESVSRLLKICQRTGLKRSGAYQIEPRIIVEINGVDSMQVPIGEDGKILADKDYLEFLVNLLNAKFKDNEHKIREFAKEFSNL